MNSREGDFLSRRQFVLSAAAAVATASGARCDPFPPLAIRRQTLTVGAAQPFKVVHVTDAHLALCDGRDGDPKTLAVAARRRSRAPAARHHLDEAVRLAHEEKALLVSTGDFWDFISVANLEEAGRRFSADDWIAAPGNHEYSRYLEDDEETEEAKVRVAPLVRKACPNDLAFHARVVNGVNFITLDDSYYQVTEEILMRFEKEVEKGLPIVLLAHVPFATPKLIEKGLEVSARSRMGRCGWVTGAPESVVRGYGSDLRIRTQMPTAVTAEFVRRLRAEKLVRGILAGHVHFAFSERFSSTAIQHVGDALFRGSVGLVTVV